MGALVVGFTLILYGLNGRVITHAGRDGVKSESPPPLALDTAQKEEQRKHSPAAQDAAGGNSPLTPDQCEAVSSTAANLTVSGPDDSPSPVAPPRSVIPGAEEDYGFYEVDGVPDSVVLASLRKWPPTMGTKPSRATFEWALRKRGQGNHPWLLKFRDRDVVRVSYGGQGKRGPTVQRADEPPFEI